MFCLSYFTKNPFSRCCLATSDNFWNLGKFIVKVIPSVYFVADINGSFENVYMFALAVMLCGYIFLFRLFSRHTFNERYFYFTYCCEITIAWFCLVNILQFYLSIPGKPNLCFYYTLVGAVPLCYTLCKIEQESKHKVFLEGIRNVKKNKQVAEEFLYMILETAEKSHEHSRRIQLLGFMKIHNSTCEKDSGCICHSFLDDFFRKQKITAED